jgi:subtilisin-like proprotein convertase family protein
MSGTSMATPHVSGVAALAWSLKADATVQQVKDALLTGVDKLPLLTGAVATSGRLNALGTLRALTNNLSGTAYNDADADGVRGSSEAGLSGRTVYLDLNNNAVLDSATTTLASADVPLAIPDQGSVQSALPVAGLGGVVTDVDVKLDLTHTYDADLFVFLTSPAGRTVQLVGGAGGAGDNFTGTVLDDEAATSITSGAAPFAGRFRPQGSLSDFDGQGADGTWTLQVYDDGQYDVGTLRNWSLTLTTGDPARTTDAAGSYAFPRLSPGQYVVRQVVPPGWAGTAPAAGYHVVDFVDGQAFGGRDFGSRLVPVADANDQLAEAANHAVGYYATSSVENATDVDVWGFDVVAGQRVSFDVDATSGSALDSYLRLFNAAGSQLAASDNAAAPGETPGALSYIEYTFSAAGRYYVAVSGAPNGAYDVSTGEGDAPGSTGGYTLTLLNRVVGADADDQLGEARALAVGATTAAESISAGTDVDVFKFTAAANQRIGFDVDRTAGSALDSYLRVFDAAGRQLTYNDNGFAPGEPSTSASYVEFTFPAAGTYFVAVSGSPNRAYSATSGGGDVYGSTGGYTLTLTSRATAASLGEAAAQPTVSELRARRAAKVFSESLVTLGEAPVAGEDSIVLTVLDAGEA